MDPTFVWVHPHPPARARECALAVVPLPPRNCLVLPIIIVFKAIHAQCVWERDITENARKRGPFVGLI